LNEELEHIEERNKYGDDYQKPKPDMKTLTEMRSELVGKDDSYRPPDRELNDNEQGILDRWAAKDKE